MGIHRSNLEISGASMTFFGPEEYAISYPSEETEYILDKVAQAKEEVDTSLRNSVLQGKSLAVQSDAEYYVNGVPRGKRFWISVDRSRNSPKCFDQYRFMRRSLYKTLFDTAVNAADFSNFVTFASNSEDSYYAGEMLADIESKRKPEQCYVWTAQSTIDMVEARRENHNDRIKALQLSIGIFAAQLYEMDKHDASSAQKSAGSSIWRVFNKKQKTKVLLENAFYSPLSAAADRPSIEHVFVADALK